MNATGWSITQSCSTGQSSVGEYRIDPHVRNSFKNSSTSLPLLTPHLFAMLASSFFAVHFVHPVQYKSQEDPAQGNLFFKPTVLLDCCFKSSSHIPHHSCTISGINSWHLGGNCLWNTKSFCSGPHTLENFCLSFTAFSCIMKIVCMGADHNGALWFTVGKEDAPHKVV